MWQKLPRWIWIGAWLLAFIAGMVNVVGLLGFEHQALTHMTGLTSRLAAGIAQLNAHEIFVILATMASFVGGAALSGLIINDSALHWGSRYGLALFIESVLLAGGAILLGRDLLAGFLLASFACGLQNAMASNFSGSVLRTTHVSGMFTDLGISIGHKLRGLPVERLRLRICVSTISGFLTGGIAGVGIFTRIGAGTLYVPAGMCLVLAIVYRLMLSRRKPQ